MTKNMLLNIPTYIVRRIIIHKYYNVSHYWHVILFDLSFLLFS
jgi:hypothetical protein